MIAVDNAATTAATLEEAETTTTAGPDGQVLRLREVPLRRTVELVSIDLPADTMVPLLERGIVPGCRMCPLRRSPSGDPILLVDGVVIALRREMAECLCVRDVAPDAD